MGTRGAPTPRPTPKARPKPEQLGLEPLENLTPARIETFPRAVLFEIKDLISKEQRTEEGVYKDLRRPFQEELDNLRTLRKPKIDRLIYLRGVINNRLLELERQDKRDEAFKALQSMKKLTDPPENVLEIYVPQQKEPIKKVRLRKTLRWRILDQTKIPIDFLQVDDQKLREAGKAGAKVPGVQFYYDEVPY